MLEYIFFDERPWQRFIEFLQAERLDPTASKGMEGWLVALPDPKLMQRLLKVLTPEELGDFVNTIVDAVENPDERPFCQR